MRSWWAWWLWHAQFNNWMTVEVPTIGGGIDRMGRPWTGGSLDLKDHDYHLGANAKPYNVCCIRTEEQEQANHKSISKGVENCTKLTPKSNLLLHSKTIWTGIVTNKFDSYFYVQDVHTACGKYITKEAYAGDKSYESIHKWPRQQHHISAEHRALWTTCMGNITQYRSRLLHQPLGTWKTAPTTIRPYRMAGDKLLVQQQDGSWIQHDQCLHQPRVRSPGIHFVELGANTSSSPESIE